MSTPDKNPSAYRNLKRVALVLKKKRCWLGQRAYDYSVTHVIDIDPMAYKEGAHEALIELEMMSGSLGIKGQDFHDVVVLGDNQTLHRVLFENVKMSRSNLRGVKFNLCGFDRSFLHGSLLADSRFDDCEINAMNAMNCDMKGVEFVNCSSSLFRLDDSRLEDADIIACELYQASFAGCNLDKATFQDSTIFNSSFDGATGRTVDIKAFHERIQVDKQTSDSIMGMYHPISHRIA